MSSASNTQSRRKWTWQPLAFAVGFSALLHLLGTFAFNATGVTTSPPQPNPPLVTFLSPTIDTPALQEFRQWITVSDPSISSLPNPYGFSHTTIARRPDVPSLIETREDNPKLLPRKAIDPLRLMLVSKPPLSASLFAHASKERAFFVDEMDSERIEIKFPKPESTFVLGGQIRDRPFLSLVSVPLVRNPAPPQPTVVRIAVAPAGDIKFAVVEKTSGSDEKDARALDIIRRWRFQVLPDQTVDQWGTVSVYWAAETFLPPAPTNTETNAPVRGEPK